MTPAISELGVSRHGQHKPSHYIRSPQGPLTLGAPDLPGCRARGRAARGAAQVSRCPALAAPRAPHGGARREGRCTASPAQARARRGHRLPRPPFPTRPADAGALPGGEHGGTRRGCHSGAAPAPATRSSSCAPPAAGSPRPAHPGIPGRHRPGPACPVALWQRSAAAPRGGGWGRTPLVVGRARQSGRALPGLAFNKHRYFFFLKRRFFSVP